MPTVAGAADSSAHDATPPRIKEARALVVFQLAPDGRLQRALHGPREVTRRVGLRRHRQIPEFLDVEAPPFDNQKMRGLELAHAAICG